VPEGSDGEEGKAGSGSVDSSGAAAENRYGGRAAQDLGK